MSASAAAPTDAGDSAAPPPSPSSAEPLLPTRHIVRPRERVFPPISILALMELKASTIHEDDRPFSAPSNAQRLLTRLAVRNKITHGEDNEPAPVTLPLKREAGELSEAAPAITEAGEGTPAPAEAQPTEQQREGEDPKQTAAPVVPVKRRRARRDVILGEIRAVAEMKGEDVAHLMQAELAENGNLPHVYPEDIVEFQSALFTASTMYSTEGGSTKKQASKNKIKVFAGKPCYSCRRAHVLCDYQRPCSRCIRLEKADCMDFDLAQKFKEDAEDSNREGTPAFIEGLLPETLNQAGLPEGLPEVLNQPADGPTAEE